MAGADGRRIRAPTPTTFAPYIVHPLAPLDFDKQIPKKGDQRQMEPWQRIGTYAAGLALDSAGVKGNAEMLARMDMIVAAGGGERDFAVDARSSPACRSAQNPAAFLNERLMSDLRPTLFLAQLSNLLAGNISIVHGVTGSSRTFMGEEAAGVDAVRIALARIAAGQSDIALVGGAHNGERPDMLMLYEFGGLNLKERFAPVWERAAASGGMALGSLGAFLVIEARDACRGARRQAAGAAVRGALRPLQAQAGRPSARRWRGCGTSSRPRSRPATPRCSPAPPAPRPRPPRSAPSWRRMATLPCAPPAPISGMGWSRNSP